MRRILTPLATLTLVVCTVLVAAAGPASAGGFVASGVGACQPDGSFLITWTLTNPTDPSGGHVLTILGANLDGVATQVVFSPTVLASYESATATSSIAGTVAATVTVDIGITFTTTGQPDQSVTMTASVDAPGDCLQPVATTVTAAPTTAQRAAVLTAPRFTG